METLTYTLNEFCPECKNEESNEVTYTVGNRIYEDQPRNGWTAPILNWESKCTNCSHTDQKTYEKGE